MDYASLPHFCRKEGSGSSRHYGNGLAHNCFSLDHAFHQELYNYIKQQAVLMESVSPIKQGSFHVRFPEPDPEEANIAKAIESEFQKFENQNGLAKSLNDIRVNGAWNLDNRDSASLHLHGTENPKAYLVKQIEILMRRKNVVLSDWCYSVCLHQLNAGFFRTNSICCSSIMPPWGELLFFFTSNIFLVQLAVLWTFLYI